MQNPFVLPCDTGLTLALADWVEIDRYYDDCASPVQLLNELPGSLTLRPTVGMVFGNPQDQIVTLA